MKARPGWPTYLPPNTECSLGMAQAYTHLVGRGGGNEVVLLRRVIL